MPLTYASEPANGGDLVHAGVTEVLARRSPLTGKGVAADDLRVDQPHMIYDLRADEIARGAGLESAHATGYRYLVHAGGVPVAAGEVHTDEHGEAKVLANLNYGGFVQASADAFAKLENLDQVRSHHYEARLLRFSSVYLLAIWLASATEEPDIIFPLAPAPPPLEAERPYSAEEFLTAVAPLARGRVQAGAPERVP